jgi:hypothetical protein
MSANAATKVDKPESAQFKITQKLEKEIAALKKNNNVLAAMHGPAIRIATSKDLGDHVVLAFGVSGSERAHELVYHKPIGTVATMPPGTWCVSESRDIQAFLDSRDHPAKKKISANLTQNKDEIALSAKLLEKKLDGSLGYPAIPGARSEYIDVARELRTLFVSARGGGSSVPSVEFFMTPAIGALEIAYRHGIRDSAAFATKVKPSYMHSLSHQPHTLGMVTQRAAPFLYGSEVGQLEQLVYNRSLGHGTQAQKPPGEYIIIEESLPQKTGNFLSPADFDTLKDALSKFETCKKDFHKLEERLKPKELTKDEKKNLTKEKTEAQKILDQAKVHVRLADKFNESTYPIKLPIISRSDWDAQTAPKPAA